MTPVRGLAAIFLPGGAVTLAGLILLRPGVLPEFVEPYVQAYPFVVFGAGAVLGWYFHRSRIIFALSILAAVSVILRYVGNGYAAPQGVERLVFTTLAVLLPLNLAWCAVLRERGLFTAPGVARFVWIAGQVLAIDLIVRLGWDSPRQWLEYTFIDPHWMAWTALPQTALAGFAVAITLLVVRCVRRRDPIEAAFVWTLVSVALALHGIGWGWTPRTSLATAGLVLVWALLETTYRMAYYDELTGLPGRRALNEALLQLGNRYAVAMVDVDHFKRFNDVFGHDVGDQTLRMVATKLSQMTGGGKAFRHGGEEFVVLFARASAAEAVPHLEAARRAVAASSFVLRGSRRPRKKPSATKPPTGPRVTVSVTISIGLAEPDSRKQGPQQVLKAADKALYRAKSAGRNRLMV